MEKEALKRIFDFLEEKEQHNAPFKWKLLNNIPLTEEELNVKDYLDLRDTNITSLPKGLEVAGWLDLSNTQITSLPEGLEVGGDLGLGYCKSLASLPEGLKVGGDLFLTDCKNITSLPKGLEVGESLYIKYSELQKFTDDELREMIYPGFIKEEIIRD